jgi:hypothetical protein
LLKPHEDITIVGERSATRPGTAGGLRWTMFWTWMPR